MFKKGDKVQRIIGTHEDMIPGEIAIVKRQDGGQLLYLEGYDSAHNPQNFKLVKEEKKEMQFDMHSKPWFIRVNNEQEYDAAVNWVKSKGLDFKYNGGYFKGLAAISNYLELDGSIDDSIYRCDIGDDLSKYHEIKFTFKTVIDSVTFPEVKTEQQKQIEELERTILLAQQQIEELKKI